MVNDHDKLHVSLAIGYIARVAGMLAINRTLKYKLIQTVCQSIDRPCMQQTLSDLAAGTRLEHAVATEVEYEIAPVVPLFIGTSQ